MNLLKAYERPPQQKPDNVQTTIFEITTLGWIIIGLILLSITIFIFIKVIKLMKEDTENDNNNKNRKN